MSENKENESEFGRGLVICLVKFAEHSAKLSRILEQNLEMKEKYPGDGDMWSESQAVHMYLNGASDHLYELEIPEKLRIKNPYLYLLVKQLKEKGLKIGHGLEHNSWTKEDAYHLQDLVQEIALEIDKFLGCENPQIGQW